MEIPKIFWKFYDLYRRGLLTLEEFSESTSLSAEFLQKCLSEVTS